jgi:AraC-like DNA-binding protein
MRGKKLPWKREYPFVEPEISAEGVRLYPFERSFPLDISFLYISGRKHVRINRHEFFEVMYMYGGSTQIQIREGFFRARKGDLVVIGPNLYHRIFHQRKADLKMVSLNFQPEIIQTGKPGVEEEVRLLSPFLYQDSQFPHIISASQALSGEAFQLMLKMYKELPARTALNRVAIRTYLRMLLLLLLKHYADYLGRREITDGKQKDIQRLQPLFHLLDQNCGQHIEVRDAARVCAMSASHFMRFFKSTIGQPFRAYLTSLRIVKAQHMLSHSEFPIAEIGQQVGFCSQSYFGEVFLALVGMTPRTYRQRARANMQQERKFKASARI